MNTETVRLHQTMKEPLLASASPRAIRRAVYTCKSNGHNLDMEFNSLDAQRESCEAYIKSQMHDGWQILPDRYDDGGIAGGSLERPDLQRLLADIRARKIDNVVVYKVDRLTRSLTDFAKLVELFDAHGVSFVSVTQAFNTTNSMGRLTLNVLLSFAQFEREVIAERVRDEVAASRHKGLWMGGSVPLGYINQDKKLVIVPDEAKTVRWIFQKYLELGQSAPFCRSLIGPVSRPSPDAMPTDGWRAVWQGRAHCQCNLRCQCKRIRSLPFKNVKWTELISGNFAPAWTSKPALACDFAGLAGRGGREYHGSMFGFSGKPSVKTVTGKRTAEDA